MFRGLHQRRQIGGQLRHPEVCGKGIGCGALCHCGGFALAAGTVMLVERYGHVFAYWAMAGGLAAVGLVAALAVRVKEHEEEVADEKAEAKDTAEVATEVAAQAPLALLGGLFTLPGGPGTRTQDRQGAGQQLCAGPAACRYRHAALANR